MGCCIKLPHVRDQAALPSLDMSGCRMVSCLGMHRRALATDVLKAFTTQWRLFVQAQEPAADTPMPEARTTADGDVAQAAETSGDAAMEDAPGGKPSRHASVLPESLRKAAHAGWSFCRATYWSVEPWAYTWLAALSGEANSVADVLLIVAFSHPC